MGQSQQSLSEREDQWLREATAAAIAGARNIVLGNGARINMNTPVGRLRDLEWGWIITAAIFAWIAVKAEQATSEGFDVEQTIRMGMLDPSPWDTGMIETILSRLADVPVDWTKPLADWSRDEMIAFLLTVLDLIRQATVARDLGGGLITRKSCELPEDPIPV
jgi:hypothetical protein